MRAPKNASRLPKRLTRGPHALSRGRCGRLADARPGFARPRRPRHREAVSDREAAAVRALLPDPEVLRGPAYLGVARTPGGRCWTGWSIRD